MKIHASKLDKANGQDPPIISQEMIRIMPKVWRNKASYRTMKKLTTTFKNSWRPFCIHSRKSMDDFWRISTSQWTQRKLDLLRNASLCRSQFVFAPGWPCSKTTQRGTVRFSHGETATVYAAHHCSSISADVAARAARDRERKGRRTMANDLSEAKGISGVHLRNWDIDGDSGCGLSGNLTPNVKSEAICQHFPVWHLSKDCRLLNLTAGDAIVHELLATCSPFGENHFDRLILIQKRRRQRSVWFPRLKTKSGRIYSLPTS